MSNITKIPPTPKVSLFRVVYADGSEREDDDAEITNWSVDAEGGFLAVKLKSGPQRFYPLMSLARWEVE